MSRNVLQNSWLAVFNVRVSDILYDQNMTVSTIASELKFLLQTCLA